MIKPAGAYSINTNVSMATNDKVSVTQSAEIAIAVNAITVSIEASIEASSIDLFFRGWVAVLLQFDRFFPI
jgi:hypothetical protein